MAPKIVLSRGDARSLASCWRLRRLSEWGEHGDALCRTRREDGAIHTEQSLWMHRAPIGRRVHRSRLPGAPGLDFETWDGKSLDHLLLGRQPQLMQNCQEIGRASCRERV